MNILINQRQKKKKKQEEEIRKKEKREKGTTSLGGNKWRIEKRNVESKKFSFYSEVFLRRDERGKKKERKKKKCFLKKTFSPNRLKPLH